MGWGGRGPSISTSVFNVGVDYALAGFRGMLSGMLSGMLANGGDISRRDSCRFSSLNPDGTCGISLHAWDSLTILCRWLGDSLGILPGFSGDEGDGRPCQEEKWGFLKIPSWLWIRLCWLVAVWIPINGCEMFNVGSSVNAERTPPRSVRRMASINAI